MKDPVLPFWPKKSPNVFSNTPQIPQLKAFLLPRPPFITLLPPPPPDPLSSLFCIFFLDFCLQEGCTFF